MITHIRGAAALAAAGVLVAAPAALSVGFDHPQTATVQIAVAGATPPDCHANPNAIASYRFDRKTGHALSGTWSVTPQVKCEIGKTRITVRAILRRNHSAQLSSSGTCSAGLKGLCTSATGPQHKRSYGTGIRGTWDAVTTMELMGADVRTYVRSDPTHCRYRSATLTTTCTFVSQKLTIR